MIITRFAPSPTGHLHLGNIRTALFNWLIAKKLGGVMQLRIEDTDRVRSQDMYVKSIIDDLAWLGIDWQGKAADTPFFQSSQTAVYDNVFNQLKQAEVIYPCFCTDDDLKLARAAQIKKGLPPRYNGACQQLSAEVKQQRLHNNDAHVWRFYVPDNAMFEFTDSVHGVIRFEMKDIGDFVIRRSDGTFSFLLANAADDGASGVTHVFRGDDHLSNTVRQLLIFQTLKIKPPQYGHIPLIVGHNNRPLSKREGLSAVRDLRVQGYLPLALHNYLSRVGHHFRQKGGDEWASIGQLTHHFSIEGLGKSAAKYDEAQLLQRQKEAVLALNTDNFIEWVGKNNLPTAIDAEIWAELFKNNVVFPADAKALVPIFEQPLPPMTENATLLLDKADSALFYAAYDNAMAEDWATFCQCIKNATKLSGKSLFMPLRAALTGRVDGPPMQLVYPFISPEFRQQRLLQFCKGERE